jgi:hypothetical protein
LSRDIILRDQLPMPEKALQRCLVGITPQQWYELLNSFVFFWFDLTRAEAIKEKYKDSILLKFDVKKLLHYYGDKAFFTPINTGCTGRANASRSRETFVPYLQWVEHRWASEEAARGVFRKRAPQPVELVIKDTVKNLKLVLAE